MKQTLVTLTISHMPRSDFFPLLLEYLPEQQITSVALLDGLTISEINQQFAPDFGEKTLSINLQDGTLVTLSAAKVEAGLQKCLLTLEAQGCETILLCCPGKFVSLCATHAVLLQPDRIIPPLVEAIVAGHQVGIVVPVFEQIKEQAGKWKNLSKQPCFAVASPWQPDDETLIDAALSLQEQGADVLLLDSVGYHQRHRDFLQKLLGIPVLLSNTLVAKLAAELLV